jgi:hypothetical protein
MENIRLHINERLASDAGVPKNCENSTSMNDKSKAILWICFTALVASGIKYLPPYLIEQRRLDMQERVLDLKEDAFLHQKAVPTVSNPEEVHVNRSQLL